MQHFARISRYPPPDLLSAKAPLDQELQRTISAKRDAVNDGEAIWDGANKFSEIDVPVLALRAMPQRILTSSTTDVRAAVDAYNIAKERQLKSFEEGIPHSRVVRIANANNAFLSNLK